MNLTLGKRLQTIFLPFSLGFFLSYLFRVINAVLSPDLIADIGIDAPQLGLLTAVYFLTFAAFQLPLGVLLDRYGPRRVESILLMIAAAGAVVFAGADSFWGLVLGRGLIGIGVSACLMGAFKAYVMWFPRRQLPLINGLQMAAGGLGAMAATAPVEAALSLTDWRGVFILLAGVTIIVAGIIFFMVPERREGHSTETFAEQIRGIGTVAASPVFWRIAPWSTISQAAYLAVHTLWAGPWLRDVARMDRNGVAGMLMLMAVAMIAGYILLGILTERLSRRSIAPMSTAVVCMFLFLCFVSVLAGQPQTRIWIIWAGFAFFGTSGIITYAALAQRFPAHLVGRVNTLLNLMVFVIAFFLQWGIGAVLNLWPVAPPGGYAPQGYQATFIILAAIQILAVAWYGLAPYMVYKDQSLDQPKSPLSKGSSSDKPPDMGS